MGKTLNGLKAGALAGVFYGIISMVFTLIALTLFKSEVISALTSFISSNPVYSDRGITPQVLYNADKISGSAVALIGGIILGLILGFIYVHVKERLPGSSKILGGIILGLIMWITLGLVLGAAYAKEYGISYFEVYSGGSLIAALVFGYLLSVFYARQESSKSLINEPIKPSP